MKRFLLSLRSLVPILIVVLLLSACSNIRTQKAPIVTIKTGDSDIEFSVEVADNPVERLQGLMYRSSLADNAGMLFVFDTEERHSFWMQNMSISLDFIYIGADYNIVGLREDVPPCQEGEICKSFKPDLSCLYVLEVNSGTIDKYQISEGDHVEFGSI